MTAQPTRGQLEAEMGSWMTRAYEAEKRAWQAEHRLTRLEAQTNIRGRAVVMYRERAREAEAQIEAVLSVVQEWEPAEVRYDVAPILRAASTRIRRALESVPPPSA